MDVIVTVLTNISTLLLTKQKKQKNSFNEPCWKQSNSLYGCKSKTDYICVKFSGVSDLFCLCLSLLAEKQKEKTQSSLLAHCSLCKTCVPLLVSMFQSAPHIYMKGGGGGGGGGGGFPVSARKPRLLNTAVKQG